MKKKLLLLILIIVVIILTVILYINWSLKPLPEERRNMSTSNIRMLVNMEDVDDRTPIVRTYIKEEFDNFDENELNKKKEIVNGNIEGDIPALKIENGIGVIKISFEKTENGTEGETVAKVIPENIPEIKISVLETLYSEEEPKEISNSLIESEEGGIYSYEIKGYLNNERVISDEKEDFFIESMYIEIYYKVDDEDYVSIFAINTVQDK